MRTNQQNQKTCSSLPFFKNLFFVKLPTDDAIVATILIVDSCLERQMSYFFVHCLPCKVVFTIGEKV